MFEIENAFLSFGTLGLHCNFSFVKSNTRRVASGLYLKTNACRTSSFRDFYFNRITLMWNSLPENIKDSDTISSFKSKLKLFYFARLLNVFDGDNFRSLKLICPKCRRVNIFLSVLVKSISFDLKK